VGRHAEVARGALVKAPRTGGSVGAITGIVMIITRHTLLCSYQTCNRFGLSRKVRWNGGCAMLAFFIYDTDTHFTPTLKEEQDEIGIQITNIQPRALRLQAITSLHYPYNLYHCKRCNVCCASTSQTRAE
jgi:hypothetical protein